MAIAIRDLSRDDIGRAFDVRTRAFGALQEAARPKWEKDTERAIADRRALAAYDGDLLVARATIRPYAQYWGGQALPMAGIAGVVVSPEYRGKGVGTTLMSRVAERGRELGFPISTLYPATVSVYRRTGWELAGVQPRIGITTRLLRELRGEDVAVREVGPEETDQLVAISRHCYTVGRENGPRDYDAAELRRDLEVGSVFAYAATDGFVVYGWEGSDLVVYQFVAGSVGTARALWAVVGSSSSVVDTVYAYLALDDPIHQILSECVAQEVRHTRWMLRLLDVEAAIAARGYPPSAQIDVPLVIDDSQLSANCTVGRLRVSGGQGELTPDTSDSQAVRLGANGLAALYAGTSTASLTASGLLTGGTDETHAALDTAFAGRPAYLLDYF